MPHDLYIAVRRDLAGAPYEVKCTACGVDSLAEDYRAVEREAMKCPAFKEIKECRP